MKSILAGTFLCLVCLHVRSQTIRLEGRVFAEDTRLPIAGANVTISHIAETASTRYAVTDADGRFSIAGCEAGPIVLQVNHLGFVRHQKSVTLSTQSVAIGDILLRSRTIPIAEVLVRATPPAVQKVDTTEYVADAFKINRDALAEDLLMKLPGVSVIDGVVKAGGDEVKQVLVDGRPFFGTDPLLALRNLPADAIEKIQVFEKMSDQAEFTGFDDGQSVRTINLVIRESRRQSVFGKASVGYGEGGRYVAAGDGNLFNDAQRISVLGQSNNANQQGFSSQDILGGMGGPPPGGGGGPRGGRGGPPGEMGGGGPPPGGIPRPGGAMELASSMVGIQSGVSTVHSLGGNYTDFWQSGLSVSGSYFYNRSDNVNTQNVSREYGLTGDAGTQYAQASENSTNNSNHRINLRLEIPIDSANSLMATPSISFQNTDAISDLLASSMYPGTIPASSVQSISQSSGTGFTLSQNLLYRHRFDLPGRTFSIDAGVSLNLKDKSSDLSSSVITHSLSESQTGENTTRGMTLSARLAYTEPLAVNSQIQFELASSFNKGTSDTRTFGYDASAWAGQLDTSLSNSFENCYWSQRAGLSYQFRTSSVRFTTGVAFDLATLRGDRTFPSLLAASTSFESILPGVSLDYSPRIGSHLRVNYRASTQAPSISQLQDVVDNTNALQLTGGNPDLQQTHTHAIVARLLETEADHATSTMFMLSLATTRNYIANAIRTITADTLLAGGVQAYRGAQITTPSNMNGHWTARGSADFGLPFELISSNINVSASAGVTRYPGKIDEVEYSTTSLSLGGGLALGTNVSREVDCHVSYNGTYTTSRNTLYPDAGTSYFSHSASLRSALTFWECIVVRNVASYTVRTGLSDEDGETSLLWTANFGVKFLSDRRGELRLAMHDILNQNRSTTRTVTESYVEDTTNRVLPRHLLLTFEYRWM